MVTTATVAELVTPEEIREIARGAAEETTADFARLARRFPKAAALFEIHITLRILRELTDALEALEVDALTYEPEAFQREVRALRVRAIQDLGSCGVTP